MHVLTPASSLLIYFTDFRLIVPSNCLNQMLMNNTLYLCRFQQSIASFFCFARTLMLCENKVVCVCVCQLHTSFCRHRCTLLESPGCGHTRCSRDKVRPALKSKSATYRIRSPRMNRSVDLGGTASQPRSRECTEQQMTLTLKGP